MALAVIPSLKPPGDLSEPSFLHLLTGRTGHGASAVGGDWHIQGFRSYVSPTCSSLLVLFCPFSSSGARP